MKKIIALLTLVSLPAWACKCDFSHIKAAVEKPSLATLFFVGKLTEATAEGQLTFDVAKNFKGTPKGKFFLKTNTENKCGLTGLKAGEDYILVSITKTSPTARYTICNTSIEAAVAKKK